MVLNKYWMYLGSCIKIKKCLPNIVWCFILRIWALSNLLLSCSHTLTWEKTQTFHLYLEVAPYFICLLSLRCKCWPNGKFHSFLCSQFQILLQTLNTRSQITTLKFCIDTSIFHHKNIMAVKVLWNIKFLCF